MSNIGQNHIESWDELNKYIELIFKYRDSFIFRGQADHEWEIESTLTRALKRTYPTRLSDEKLISSYLNKFKGNIRGRTDLDLINSPDDDIWSLGQHFGLYTPLIDWTYSPYIALFFALQGKSNSGIRAIHSICTTEIEDINEQCPTDKQLKLISPLHHYNKRVVNQRGVFLKLPVELNIKEWVLKFGKGINSDCVGMVNFTFPDEISNDIKLALDKMNINEATLFPDLMGAAQYSNYLFDIEPLKEELIDLQHKSVK